MAVIDFGDLIINGTVIKYEGRVKIEEGSKTRKVHPQVNGGKIITTDIESARSKITIPIRSTPETNATFDEFYNLEDNNLITYRDKAYAACVMEMIPEREDQEIVEYVFFGDIGV